MPSDPSAPVPAPQPAAKAARAPFAPSAVATPTPDPFVNLTKVEFSDGTSFTLGSNDIVVLVGPNNVGKSQALRDVRGLAENPATFPGVAIMKIELALTGSSADFVRVIEARGKRQENSSNYLYHINGSQISSRWGHLWDQAARDGLRHLTPLLIHHLDVQSRLTAADTVESFNRLTGHPQFPAHYVFLHPKREEAIATAFKQAFGQGIVINRCAGREIPVLFGDRPAKQPDEEEYSESFQKKLSALPLISKQGDGMRCFA